MREREKERRERENTPKMTVVFPSMAVSSFFIFMFFCKYFIYLFLLYPSLSLD